MKCPPHASLGIILCLVFCLILVSGCTFLQPPKSNPTAVSSPPASSIPTAAVVGGACADGQTTCAGACRNTLVDSSNCGRCANVCGSGQYCNNGICAAGTMNVPTTSISSSPTNAAGGCADGQMTCSGTCRNVLVDTSNCGRCGNRCGSGQTCNTGACTGSLPVPATTVVPTTTGSGGSCSTGFMNCGGTCVSQHDENNCGACGNTCGTGEQCFWSTGADGHLFAIHCDCLSGSGTTLCGSSCLDLANDRANCGSCGNTCSSGQQCSAGICVTLTPAVTCTPFYSTPMTNCNGECVALLWDNNNCGSCNNRCSARTACCGGACTSTDTNNNCGGCGISCPTGDHCSAGTCVPDSTSPPCAKGLTSCPAAKSGTACVDLNTDSNNCGSCGHVCTTGSCSGGSCGYVLK